jgi:ATP-dependent DNA helicase RecG
MEKRAHNLKLPISLDDVLRGKSVEWERLEYKAGWNPEAVLRTMCAFANDFHNLGGGYVVIGVQEEAGRPVLPPAGICPDSLDAIQKELLNLGYSAIQPMYHPLSAPCEVDGKWILVIWVPGGETRPYKAKLSLSDKKSDWAYYIRKQSSTVRARGTDEQELVGLAATIPFDDRYNQQVSVDALSQRLIEAFLHEVGSDLAEDAQALPAEALGRQMNIVGGPSEAVFPKNVGLLFFNDAPRDFFPATQIDVVWFPDGPGGDQFEEKTFSGPLSRMTREALDYIQRNYLKETVVKHPDRAEAERFWNFPYAAVEEAVVNAVYHRSYEVREPVEVRITPEDLVVLSFPGPDRSIRMEDLRAGRAVSRRYRNRRIGEFLKELDLTEGRSTGIPKILRNMESNGSPVPEFDTDEDRTSYLVRLPMHPRSEVVTPQTTPQGISLSDSALHEFVVALDGVSTQVTTQVTTQVAAQIRSALAATREKPLSRGEIQETVGLANREHFRKKYLEPLVSLGWLEPTIPDRPTSRNQKYRLTERGREILRGA